MNKGKNMKIKPIESLNLTRYGLIFSLINVYILYTMNSINNCNLCNYNL